MKGVPETDESQLVYIQRASLTKHSKSISLEEALGFFHLQQRT